ncbi:MAG: hypothetical protein P1V36_04190 [Planctomycetota bacterium]|nr:hypothetical protein [Planctomycetota bacterium]
MALAVVVALLLAPTAAAEDDAKAATQAYAQAVKAFPLPLAEAGFEFRGVLHLNDKTLGYAELSVQDAAPGAVGQWQARDHFVLKGRAVPRVETTSASLDRSLRPLRGTVQTSDPRDWGLSWESSADGFEVEQRRGEKGPEGEPVAKDQVRGFTHQGTALHTMAALVQFCRLVPAKPTTYATTVFEPGAGMEGKPALQPLVVRVLGEQDFQGRKVLAATAVKAAKEMTVLLVPDTREVIAVRLVEGKSKLEILPGDAWVMPARDALTAGMRAMLGFSAKQLRILDDVVHWPSLHARALAGASPEARERMGDIDTWRTRMLAAWNKQLAERPVAMMQQFIGSQKAQIKAEPLTEGRVKLTFPPMLRSMVVIVAPRHGAWHVVALPPRPKPAKPAPAKSGAGTSGSGTSGSGTSESGK